MPTTIEKTVAYPIKDIYTSIAESQDIPLRYFTQEYFLPNSQRSSFPYLADLSSHLVFPNNLGIEVAKDNMTIFEGSNGNVSLAYFGKEVEEFSNITKEKGLIYVGGRRIHITLNENGNGEIEIEDKLIREARHKLGDDSFGSNFDEHPKGKYSFRQESGNPDLPGIRDFMNYLLKKQ